MKMIKERLITVLQKIAELGGIAAAAARNGYETRMKNNHIVKASQAYSEMLKLNEQDYYLAAEILAECVNNTADITGLFSVKDLHQLLWVPFLDHLPNGVWVFRYHARYRKGFGATAESIQRTLQFELDRLTGVYQCPPLKVFVTFGPDSTAVIKIGYSCDFMAAQDIQG